MRRDLIRNYLYHTQQKHKLKESKITTPEHVLLLVNLRIEVNSVDPDQTAPTGVV